MKKNLHHISREAWFENAWRVHQERFGDNPSCKCKTAVEMRKHAAMDIAIKLSEGTEPNRG